jgi:hypothetical protein
MQIAKELKVNKWENNNIEKKIGRFIVYLFERTFCYAAGPRIRH